MYLRLTYNYVNLNIYLIMFPCYSSKCGFRISTYTTLNYTVLNILPDCKTIGQWFAGYIPTLFTHHNLNLIKYVNIFRIYQLLLFCYFPYQSLRPCIFLHKKNQTNRWGFLFETFKNKIIHTSITSVVWLYWNLRCFFLW